MPGPDQWTEQDFEAAKALRASGKGSAAQKAQLEKALNSYWTRQTGNLGIADDTPEQVSRETKSSDPFAAYDAETAKLSAESEASTARAPERPGKLETFGRHAFNGMALGFGGDVVRASGLMDPMSAQLGVPNLSAPPPDFKGAEEAGREFDAELSRGQQDNPVSAFGGGMLGSMANPIMSAFGAVGGMAGRALGFTGKAGRAAEAAGAGMAQGGVEGAVMAPEGEGARGAAVGAGGGAVLGPVAAFAGDALSGMLGRKAKELTTRASGPDKADIKQTLLAKGSAGLEDFGGRLETHGIRTFEDAERVSARSSEVIGQLSKTARNKVDLTEAGTALVDEAQKLLRMRNPQANALGKQIIDSAEPMLGRWETVKIAKTKMVEQRSPILDASGGPITKMVSMPDGYRTNRIWARDTQLSYADAHTLRKFMDELVHKASQMGQKDTPLANRLSRGADGIRKAMDDAASKEGPEFHAAMKHANDGFSTSKQALEYLADQRAGDMTDYIQSTNMLTAGLSSGKRRSRLTAPAARFTSRAIDRRATLPELAPQLGGGALGYFVPEEESQ